MPNPEKILNFAGGNNDQLSANMSYPLEGGELAQVARGEIIEAISIAPTLQAFFGEPSMAVWRVLQL